MPTDPESTGSGAAPVDVAALAAEVRAEAEARRRRGEYPPGLEEELSGHLERITPAPPLAVHRLQERAAAVAAAARLVWPTPELASRVPGGAALHGAVARLVSRHVGGLVAQLQTFTSAVDAALTDLVATVQEPATHLHADVIERLDALEDRLAAIERALSLQADHQG